MAEQNSKLLFISPTVPQPAGNGRAMRAYHMIELLSARYRVYLLVISREIPARWNLAWQASSALCHDTAFVRLAPFLDLQMLFQVRIYKLSQRCFHRFFSPLRSPYLTSKMGKVLAKVFPEIAFDVIHVFRLSMFPFGIRFIQRGFSGIMQMDLDDIESLTAYRLSRLYRVNGNRKMEKICGYEARRYEFIEKRILPSFDRVFVCSQIDKERIIHECNNGDVTVIPNTVEIPDDIPTKSTNTPFTFLFVGTLGYYPNHDGIIYFCRSILPIIKKTVDRDFLIRIVGAGASKSFKETLAGVSNVDLVGDVPDVAPFYARADAVIVPLRAGGGTRIKILEAFAHQCPVISTTLGVEGIDGKADEHFLTADTSDRFAFQCRRMMAEPQLRKDLIRNAYALVKEKYQIESIKNRLPFMQ